MSENTHPITGSRPEPEQITKAIERRSFCTLATTSAANRPHVAGVLYDAVGSVLYVSTHRTSKKARNIAGNPHVGVCIPIRRLPVGPPSTVQFQGVAEILATDDPRILDLVKAGHLKSITSHGELDLPDGCFLRITPARRVNTYGLGMSLRQLLRDPINAGGYVELAAPSHVESA
ncbi:MAG TPA: pyridoxamine 5'-phosphate oxidase family protein [Acidimicrobiia bacterium]|nr:pyridoxamine 5'-phosphate oxidase family protein [Acidimicrobiia bacterium]